MICPARGGEQPVCAAGELGDDFPGRQGKKHDVGRVGERSG